MLPLFHIPHLLYSFIRSFFNDPHLKDLPQKQSKYSNQAPANNKSLQNAIQAEHYNKLQSIQNLDSPAESNQTFDSHLNQIVDSPEISPLGPPDWSNSPLGPPDGTCCLNADETKFPQLETSTPSPDLSDVSCYTMSVVSLDDGFAVQADTTNILQSKPSDLTRPGDKQKAVCVSFGDSDSDFEDYLSDVVSIKPVAVQVKNSQPHASSTSPSSTGISIHPSVTTDNVGISEEIEFTNVTTDNVGISEKIGFTNVGISEEIGFTNDHIVFEDDEEQGQNSYYCISQNTLLSTVRETNISEFNFLEPSRDQQNSLTQSQASSTGEEITDASSDSPDTELPSYCGELNNQSELMPSNQEELPSNHEDSPSSNQEVSPSNQEPQPNKEVSFSNPAAAVGDLDEEDWDNPSATSSLTSHKSDHIQKYVPRERQRRKRSDPEWVRHMEKCMVAGARTKILNSLRQCYRDAFDTYHVCCDLLLTFGITHASGRTVFQRAALDEIALWKVDTVAPRPTISHKLKALDVSYLCNSSLFKAIMGIFELDSLPLQDAVQFVHGKLDHKKLKYLKHMALIVTELNLQEYFDTMDMLFPLLGMDKMMTIEAYLANKTIATKFVTAMDDLLEPSGAILWTLLDHLTHQFDYNRDTANFKFTPEQISTLIKRLVKVHTLGSSAAPNVFLSKTISNLKSMLYCRYRKGYNEDWTSSLVSTVANNEYLQKALFSELLTYRDFNYARQLYKEIQPRLDILPGEIQDWIQTEGVAESSKSETPSRELLEVEEALELSRSVEKKLLLSSLPTRDVTRTDSIPISPQVTNGYISLPNGVSVCDVGSPAALTVCKDVLSSALVIGLDSEWRALLDPAAPSPVALLQLAAHNSCFLLDMPKLLDTCTDQDISEFVEAVFTEQVTVVGYALTQDFTKLTETLPTLGTRLTRHAKTVDLAVAHKHLTKVERVKRSQEIRALVSEGRPLPTLEGSKETGLARLCQMLFGHPLNKTYQVSDWTRRPLFPEQREYAALDAQILLSLFHKLTATFHPTPLLDLKLEGLDMPKECKEAMYVQASTNPTPAHLLRVVVDIPLQGLGKKLRHVGVDTVILDNSQSLDDAAKISLKESRVILSKDSNAARLTKLTDPGRVYKVTSPDAASQLAEIREHFSLVITDADLFSRCAICNCPHFVKLPAARAAALKESQQLCNTSSVEEEFPVSDRRQSLVEVVSVSRAGVTQYGVRLQLDKVKIGKFQESKTFWGCCDCGKMYWEGCHMKNFKEKHNI